MEATMKVTRITMAECISEEALEKAVEDHRNSAAQVWPTAEFTLMVKAGPTSMLNVTVYPSEDAANATLDAREKWFEKNKHHLKDTFYYEGELMTHLVITPPVN